MIFESAVKDICPQDLLSKISCHGDIDPLNTNPMLTRPIELTGRTLTDVHICKKCIQTKLTEKIISIFRITIQDLYLFKNVPTRLLGPLFLSHLQWLPERPTFAVGMIVCGFGGGALIFNQVVTAYINPDNLSPDLETADGERYIRFFFNLKWHYAQFSLQNLACTCYIFQKIAINNDK